MTDEPEPNEDSPATPAETVALQAKVDQLERQVADFKSLVADERNSTRRLREDAEKQKKYATERLAGDLLPVYDTLDRALSEAKKAADNAIVLGVTATLTLFLDTLKRHGATKIETSINGPFDPNLHMAVMQQKAEGIAPGNIATVLQHGFMLHDRVLRPATVIVATD